MTPVLLLLAAVVLVVLCGVFVAAEFAFLAADRPTVERAAATGNRRAAGTLAALRTLSTQLSGVQVAITLTNLGIGFLAEPALAALLEGPLGALGVSGSAVGGVAVVVALVASTALTMIVGELIPKNLAIAAPVRVAGAVQLPVRAFTRAMGGPIRWLNGLAEAILHRFGLEVREELASARSADELMEVVRHSQLEGRLESGTATLVTRSLRFGARRAQDAMTPRVRVRTVRDIDPAQQVILAAAESGHSRFPVIGESVDDVVGVIALGAALAVPRARRDLVPVADVMDAPTLVPTSLPFDGLLHALQRSRSGLGVVVDEYGGTAGVITLEDVAEELVGDVVDEFDTGSTVVADPDGGLLVPAGLRPDEVRALTGLPVPDGDWSTVAGLVLNRLGAIPGAGVSTDVDGVRWTVRTLQGHRIVTLHVRPVGDA